jgi:hypothetical protein
MVPREQLGGDLAGPFLASGLFLDFPPRGLAAVGRLLFTPRNLA